jgi:transcriptional regulator with XRE-family HTH domain
MKHIKGSKAEIEFAKRIEARTGDWDFHFDEALLFLIEDILKQMEKGSITRSMLANQIGASRSYITQVLSGKPNLRLSTLFKICFALGVKPKIRLENIAIDDSKSFEMFESGSFIVGNIFLPRIRKSEPQTLEQYNEA